MVTEPADSSAPGLGRWLTRRLREILRQEGWRGVRFRALALLGWRSCGLYVRGLDASATAVTAAVPAEIRELGAADARDYLAFRSEAPTRFLRRLHAGHACFAARHDGRIVAATWVAVGRGRLEYLGRDVLLAPDEIYLFDSFTASELRGRRLFPAIFAVIAATYRARGYRHAVTCIAVHNRSSRRSRERSGFRRIGTVRRLPRKPIRLAGFAACDGGRQDPPPGLQP